MSTYMVIPIEHHEAYYQVNFQRLGLHIGMVVFCYLNITFCTHAYWQVRISPTVWVFKLPHQAMCSLTVPFNGACS